MQDSLNTDSGVCAALTKGGVRYHYLDQGVENNRNRKSAERGGINDCTLLNELMNLASVYFSFAK